MDTQTYNRVPARRYTQILVDGRWRTVTASLDYVGGRGYQTTWWLTTLSGEGVGYSTHAMRRKHAEGTARTMSEAEYHRWADEETIRLLLSDKTAPLGVGVN